MFPSKSFVALPFTLRSRSQPESISLCGVRPGPSGFRHPHGWPTYPAASTDKHVVPTLRGVTPLAAQKGTFFWTPGSSAGPLACPRPGPRGLHRWGGPAPQQRRSVEVTSAVADLLHFRVNVSICTPISNLSIIHCSSTPRSHLSPRILMMYFQ